MGDSSDVWRETRVDRIEESKRRRASNRQSSAQILRDHGIEFIEKNNGAHLIVKSEESLIDFWPGTGKYIVRNGKTGRGVFGLIKLCNKRKTNER